MKRICRIPSDYGSGKNRVKLMNVFHGDMSTKFSWLSKNNGLCWIVSSLNIQQTQEYETCKNIRQSFVLSFEEEKLIVLFAVREPVKTGVRNATRWPNAARMSIQFDCTSEFRCPSYRTEHRDKTKLHDKQIFRPWVKRFSRPFSYIDFLIFLTKVKVEF